MRYRVFRILYFVLMVLWIAQIAFGGFNIYILIPTICLVLCYYFLKKAEREQN